MTEGKPSQKKFYINGAYIGGNIDSKMKPLTEEHARNYFSELATHAIDNILNFGTYHRIESKKYEKDKQFGLEKAIRVNIYNLTLPENLENEQIKLGLNLKQEPFRIKNTYFYLFDSTINGVSSGTTQASYKR